MSSQDDTILVGAVAYHERIVPIWEGFRTYFNQGGLPVDYVLYSNYERLVEALLSGEVDLGWNTNTAYVSAEHRIGGNARVLGMRDVDADFRTVIVTRSGEAFDEPSQLSGKRLALGSRDSGHAAILPLHYLAKVGLEAERKTTLVRFDTDLGKHGDTGDSELLVLRAVADGDADAGAVGDAMWARLRAERFEPSSRLEVAWASPTYYHCNFTALPTFDPELAARWLDALLAMDYNDPTLRHLMDLEGVKQWRPGDKTGYQDLTQAMLEQGYLA